jgi:hypothetical protein
MIIAKATNDTDPLNSPNHNTQHGYISDAINLGWIPIDGTFTYASATTINVSAGAASIYSIGDKLRFQNNDSGTYLYANITTIADTLLTVRGATVPNATLTDAYYSKISNPQGFSYETLLSGIWSTAQRRDLRCEFGAATIAATGGAGAYNGGVVTFTKAFVTSVLVFMEVYGNDSSKVDNITHNAQSLSVTGFTPRIYVNTYSAPGTPVILAWMAVGY